jgi:hypothetical protein
MWRHNRYSNRHAYLMDFLELVCEMCVCVCVCVWGGGGGFPSINYNVAICNRENKPPKLSGYRYAPPVLILNIMRVFPHCISVFHIRLMKNSDYFPVLQEPIDLPSENIGQSHWPRRLRHESASSPLLEVRIRIPPEAWIFVSCECYVLPGRGLCVGLITRPEESYRVWCQIECDHVSSIMRRPRPSKGCRAVGGGEEHCVLCGVGTEPLFIMWIDFSLQRVK